MISQRVVLESCFYLIHLSLTLTCNNNNKKKPALTIVQKTMLAPFVMLCDLGLLTPEINGFPGIMVDGFYVKFDDPCCSVILDIVQVNGQTDKCW